MGKISIRQIASRIEDLELWALGLAVVASILKPSLLPIVIGTALFFWLERWISQRKLTRRTPLDLPMIYIMLMAPVTLWATAIPEKTEIQVLRLLSGIALFYALVNWCHSKQRLKLALFFLISAGLILVAIAPFSVQWNTSKLSFIPPDLYDRFVLLVQDTTHPNVMAGSLVIIFPIALGVVLFGWREIDWLTKLATLGAAILIPLILVLTQSRAAWISLALVLMVMFLLRFRWGWALAGLAVAAVAVGVYLIGINNAVDYISSSGAIGGIDGRIEVWSRAIYMIQDFAFTGIGMGTFGDVADLLYPFFLYAPGSIPHAHNLFLQIAVDLGVMGLVAWLAALIGVSIVAWQLYRKNSVGGVGLAKGIGAGIICSLIALVEQGILDAVTWGMVRPAPLVWIIWGMCIAAWYVYADEKDHEVENRLEMNSSS